MNLYLADQALNRTDSHVMSFAADKLGKPASIRLAPDHEDPVQLELPIDDERLLPQDPLIAEALRIFSAEMA